jgi:hypothetical protein
MPSPVVTSRLQTNDFNPVLQTEGTDFAWGGNGSQNAQTSTFVDVTATALHSDGTSKSTWSMPSAPVYQIGRYGYRCNSSSGAGYVQILHDGVSVHSVGSGATATHYDSPAVLGGTYTTNFLGGEYGGVVSAGVTIVKVQIRSNSTSYVCYFVGLTFSWLLQTAFDTARPNANILSNGTVTRNWKGTYLGKFSHICHFGGSITLDGQTSTQNSVNYRYLEANVLVDSFTLTTPSECYIFYSATFIEVA